MARTPARARPGERCRVDRSRFAAAGAGPRRPRSRRRWRGARRHPRRAAPHAALRDPGAPPTCCRRSAASGSPAPLVRRPTSTPSASRSPTSRSATRSAPASRTVTLADIEHFAEFTGDTFYAHTDEAAARKNPLFGGIVAHGYLVVSLAAGLFVDPDPGPVLANFGVDRLRFLTPVKADDSIRVTLTVKQITPRSNADYGEVRWDATVVNASGEPVATYDVLTLVAKTGLPDGLVSPRDRRRLDGHGPPKEMSAVITLGHDPDSIHRDLEHRLARASTARPDVRHPRDHYGAIDTFLAVASRHNAGMVDAIAPLVHRLPDGHDPAVDFVHASRRYEETLAQVKAKLYGSAYAAERGWRSIWQDVRREFDVVTEMERRLVQMLLAEPSPEDPATRLHHATLKAPTRPHPFIPHRGVPGRVARMVARRIDQFWDSAEGRMVPEPVRHHDREHLGKLTQYLPADPHLSED
ncbi:MaoC/PaaZ C-terminal domain-containing protein [Nocardioides sp. B-3]|uniref:MaoC/PaaZ C-terminal domain-containing protein n=1 Tax=Nocardioides sp. B-3 TaxID=2895565 RepID=UPI00300E3E7A